MERLEKGTKIDVKLAEKNKKYSLMKVKKKAILLYNFLKK